MSTQGSIPAGWVQLPLADFVRHRSGNSKLIKGKLPSAFAPGLFPAFSASGQDVWIDHAEYLEPGIVLSAVGARCGKAFLATGQWTAIANSHALIPDASVFDQRFLWYRLNDERFWIRSGSAQPFVLVAKTLERELHIPPLCEQRRIVDEVEKQFTRLDAAVTSLQRVKANLKRYRASVLKAACEGRLVPTEAELARREGRSFESGEELLKRILKERRTRWEADQLAKMKAAGRVPAGEAWKAKYENPSELDSSGAPGMPEGWRAVSGAQLFTWRSGDFLPASQQVEGAFPVYGGNGIAGVHDQENCNQATLVVGRVGAQCGNVHVSTGPAWITDNAILAGFVPTDVNLRFVWLAFKRADLRKQSKGVGQPFVNQSTLNEAVLPLPPLPEQHRIVAEVERRLSVVDELEATVEKNLARCARLRQSILKMAFEGRLVPQDPNDEPASVLLERIRSARAVGAISATSPSTGSPRGRKRAKHP